MSSLLHSSKQTSDRDSNIASILDHVRRKQEKFDFRTTHRCFLTLTYAQSLDGSIAAGMGGKPLRLSGDESMLMTHHLRATHDGILIGIGTVLSDNPSLNTRLCEGPSPRPIILDSSLRCPADAKFIQIRKRDKLEGPIIITSTIKEDDSTRNESRLLLERQGCTILQVPNAHDLAAILNQLHTKFKLTSVMVEGGSRVISSFLEKSHLVDCLIVTVAPQFVGGLSSVRAPLEPPLQFRFTASSFVGLDMVLIGEFPRG